MFVLSKRVRVNDGNPVDHVRVDKQCDGRPIAYEKQGKKGTQGLFLEVVLHSFAKSPSSANSLAKV